MMPRRRRSPSSVEDTVVVNVKRRRVEKPELGNPVAPPALQEIQSNQVRNGSGRVLDRVVIPKRTRSSLKEFQSQEETGPPPVDAQPSEEAGSNFKPHDIRSYMRPRRVQQRVSYLPTPSDDDASDNELQPATRTKPNAATGADDESDFEAPSVALSAEQEEDELMLSEEEEAQDPEEEDDFSDIEEMPRPRRGAKAAPKPKKPTHSESQDKVYHGNKSKKRMSNLSSGQKRHVDQSLPPLHTISGIFEDMVRTALPMGLAKASQNLEQRPLRVATMCSGTESPLLALEMVKDAMKTLGQPVFNSIHLFSAEIVPYKQAYIERNFGVPVIFRDIRDLTAASGTDHKATTAYGSKVDVPGNVDIVIAGTACVDYSNLNKKKKDIEDNGESGDTFRAVLAYAKLWRPRMLILENVFNAPWDEMMRMYEAVDYDVGGVLVDTKAFYLPQTRQRGYMLCLDRHTFGKKAADAVRTWEKTMSKLRRPASSPVTAFLLPYDDPTVLRSRNLRARQALMNDTTREVDWSKCAIRHVQYRREKGIGNSRPYTSWQESGSLTVPDYADRDWHARQVERIWDMLDCSMLRKALPTEGNYDAQFKTRVWDLSQNIDRFTDTAPFGIATCLTPTGIFFVTDRGGPLSYHESLILQGLPLDRISFTTETGANIQDLAGNAMSSTVVGAALVSALIAAPLPPLDESEPLEAPFQDIESQQPTLSSIDTSSLVSSRVSVLSPDLDVVRLVAEAAESSQMCSCEGPNDIAQKAIQTCQDCGHTSCLSCGGKPTHNYSPTHLPRRQRKDPAEFRRDWGSKIPPKLAFKSSASMLSQVEQDTSLKKQYREALQAALNEEFSFQTFHRGQVWRIQYDATLARLDLVLDGHTAVWRLFAKASSDLPGNSDLRKLLTQPVAISNTSQAGLLEGDWHLRVIDFSKGRISFVGQGGQTSSWMARQHLPGYEDQRVYHELAVTINGLEASGNSYSGTYKHLPQCGTACESLYKRLDTDNDPMYLMLDPDGIGDASDDSFVMTNNPAKLRYGETRSCMLKLDKAWRPWLSGNSFGKTECSLIQRSVSLDRADLSLTSIKLDLTLQSADLALAQCKEDCDATETLVRVDFPLSLPAGEPAISTSIAPTDKVFFAESGWVFEVIRPSLAFDQWHTLKTVHGDECPNCQPKLPDIRWRWGDGKSLKAYEDPATATTFEAELKKRPALFTIQYASKDNVGQIFVSLNLTSLAHRAITKLRRVDNSPARDLSITWRLDTAYAEASNLVFPNFFLRDNDRDKTFDSPLDMQVELWPKQRQSLAWMLQQETGHGHYMEEAEEALLPGLRWRAEARAGKVVEIRGGIQASHPGFGKTICSLALVQSDFQSQDQKGVIASMAQLASDARHADRIKIAATLIVAPKHLVKQWKDEVGKVLGKAFSSRTIAIQTANELHKYSIAQFEMARIIIVNQDVFTSDMYVKRLAQFAGMPEPVTCKGREFKSWLDFAAAEVPKSLRVLREEGKKALTKHVSVKLAECLKDETFLAVVPSKRLRGSKYAEQGITKKANTPQAASLKAVDSENLDKCLFEMFYFNRVVVDEFTYLNPKDYASILALGADKRWALSATARLQDPYDIARMASLIGASLRVGENAPGAVSMRNLRTIRDEMTDFEKFQTFRDSPSSALTERTYELAQQFLDNFVRRNVLEFDDFPYEDHLVPVTLSLSHRMVYTELSQHLNSQDMRIKKGRKAIAASRDREHQLHENLKDVESAEEALSRLAACFDDSAYDIKNEGKTVEGVARKREKQCARAEEDLGEAILECQKMTAASKGKDVSFQIWKDTMLLDQGLGDEDTVACIRKLVDSAEKKHPCATLVKKAKAGKRSNSDDDDMADAAPLAEGKGTEKMREGISNANDLAKHLLATRRSIRFVDNSKQLAAAVREGQTDVRSCDCQDCAGTMLPRDLAVSSLCGHLVCGDCFDQLLSNTGICSALGCRAPMQDYHLLKASKMRSTSSTNDASIPLGAKVAAAIELLQTIRAQDDQAILFVRYEEQIDTIEQACLNNGIRCTAVRDNNSAAGLIAQFQKDLDPETRSAVIILNASKESAAGVNLTNASHALFLSPLLTDTQYDYDSAMAQAIGRIRRPGQQKDIHVYRLLALDTIDVDILEHRERRRSPLAVKGAEELPMPVGVSEAATQNGAEERERTQLVRSGDGVFRLMPRSWLVGGDGGLGLGVEGRARVKGYEDFSSLVKFGKAYSEDD